MQSQLTSSFTNISPNLSSGFSSSSAEFDLSILDEDESDSVKEEVKSSTVSGEEAASWQTNQMERPKTTSFKSDITRRDESGEKDDFEGFDIDALLTIDNLASMTKFSRI